MKDKVLKSCCTENQESFCGNEISSIKSVKGRLVYTIYYSGIGLMSYLVMFTLMSVSFWVAIALLLGNVVGFFLFGLEKECQCDDSGSNSGIKMEYVNK